MPNASIAVRDTLQSVQRFLDDSAGLFSKAVDLTGVRQLLDDLLTTFNEALSDRHACSRSAGDRTEKQHQLNVKLRKEQKGPIAAIARVTLQGMPEFRAFKMPKPALLCTRFTSLPRATADSAPIYEDLFSEPGLAWTFLVGFKSANYRKHLRSSVGTYELEVAGHVVHPAGGGGN